MGGGDETEETELESGVFDRVPLEHQSRHEALLPCEPMPELLPCEKQAPAFDVFELGDDVWRAPNVDAVVQSGALAKLMSDVLSFAKALPDSVSAPALEEGHRA